MYGPRFCKDRGFATNTCTRSSSLGDPTASQAGPCRLRGRSPKELTGRARSGYKARNEPMKFPALPTLALSATLPV